MTTRTPRYYLLNTGNPNPAPMTREEADAVADLVRRDRRGRMGCGRLHSVSVYQQRTPGRPWSVEVRFIGQMWECGGHKYRLRPSHHVSTVRWSDGSTSNGPVKTHVG